MAYSVKTELKESAGPFPPGMRINKKLRWNVYRVKADSFLELITGIDEIEEKDLGWLHHRTEAKTVGVTICKRNGKWVAALEGHPQSQE